VLLIARTLRRFDVTAKSFFSLITPGSCFAGTLFELAIASDRAYALDDLKRPIAIQISGMNDGAYPMSNGLTRLRSRFLGEPARVDRVLEERGPYDAPAADEAGLVTAALDALDFDDEVRIAIEERVSLSPDALTGMEASLRFAGPESMETKIYGRLSAWQNWIFQRPNAVGEKGALTNYGMPTRPSFDVRRT
jgi:benzoyl-CoA-dihydrodiol lyase